MSSRISEIKRSDYPLDAAGRKPGRNTLSFLLIGIGAAILIWTGLDLVFRSTAADFNGRFCLPMAVGIAAIVWGALFETSWKSFGGWFGLALVGQAASLQMIDAGRLIHFQHYRPTAELLQTETLALSLLLLQMTWVGFWISPHLATLTKWLKTHLAIWQVLLVFAILALASAAVTPDASRYGTSLLLGTLVQLVSLANIILLAMSLPDDKLAGLREKIDRFLGESEEGRSTGLDRFSFVAALWVLVLTASLSYFVYQAHPHVPDEAQYIFQANYMAAGQLTVRAPAVPEAFTMYMVPHRDARWFGIFPPGWPAILALGVLSGFVWLVNPLFAGGCVLLTYLLFREIYDRRFARIGILLLCCSPWFIFMSMSLMGHIATLLFALGGAVLLVRGLRQRAYALIFLAGASVGIVSLMRPLDGLVVAAALGLWVIASGEGLKQRIFSAFTYAFGVIVTALIVLPYNLGVTGRAGLLPMDAYYNEYFPPDAMTLGFGPERGLGWPLDAFPGHSPLESMINAALNTFQLNTELLGWGTGSLLLIALVLVTGRLSKKDLWAWVSIASVAGAYGLYWYHGGPDFGARYWFLMIVPLVALTVRGCLWLKDSLNKNTSSGSFLDTRVFIALAMLCAMSVLAYLPWRATDKYFGYLGARPGIQSLAEEHDFGRSLVLVRGSEHPDYQSAWVYNPVDFEGDLPIYAFDKDPETRARLLAHYSDRRVWIVDGPTIANGQFRVHSGPIEPGALSSELTR